MPVVGAGRLVVVGGHSRGVGKTATIEHLLRSHARDAWIAVKVSSHRHAPAGEMAALIEQDTTAAASTQTGRYLVAGARAAWLCRAPERALPLVAGFVAGLLRSGASVIVESNRLVRFLAPETVLFVVSPPVEDWKTSSGHALAVAHAVILGPGEPACRTVLPMTGHRLAGRPAFALDVPEDMRQFASWFGNRHAGRADGHRRSSGAGHFERSDRPAHALG